MTDLVRQARELGGFSPEAELCSRMADEIERLRDALHTIFCNTEPDAIKHRDYDHLAKNICEVARAALEEQEQ